MKFLAKNNFIRQILQETKKIIFSPSLKMRRIMMTSKEIQNLYFQVKSSKQRQKCPCCSSNTRIECPDGFFCDANGKDADCYLLSGKALFSNTQP